MLFAIAVAAVLAALLLGALVLLLIDSATGARFVVYCVVFAGWIQLVTRPVHLPHVTFPELEDDGWYLAVEPGQQERLDASVERLCLLADVPAPFAAAYPAFLPQSYTIARPRRTPTVYASQGLLRALDDRGLDAVVAHELSHIANRDAALMTLLLTPTSLFGGRLVDAWRARRTRPAAGGVVVTSVVFFLPVLVLVVPFELAMTAAARVVSRHRELYADRCSAVITGSPAVVATTLMRISGERGSVNLADLRAVDGGHDELHILPDRPQPTGAGRIWATHPQIRARIARLEQLERDLQRARLAGA